MHGWMLKLAGLAGFLVLAYLITWIMDIMKGEA